MTGGFVIAGRPAPPDLLGALEDSGALMDDAGALRERLAGDGYVLLRGALEEDRVLAARSEVMRRLAEVGEVRRPAMEGIATGTSHRRELAGDLGAFWTSVSEGPALRRLTHGRALAQLTTVLLGEPARAFDFVWLRPVPFGRASPLHFDHVYMNRGSDRVLSVWLPLGDVRPEEGPLLIVEGSHRFDDLKTRYRGHDVDGDTSRPGALGVDPLAFARERDCRLLTGPFAAGDVIAFGMFTLHGSCDNASPARRVRLSCDVRYQPAADPIDERWYGAPPPGHGGGSYGALSAARPLPASPIRR